MVQREFAKIQEKKRQILEDDEYGWLNRGVSGCCRCRKYFIQQKKQNRGKGKYPFYLMDWDCGGHHRVYWLCFFGMAFLGQAMMRSGKS